MMWKWVYFSLLAYDKYTYKKCYFIRKRQIIRCLDDKSVLCDIQFDPLRLVKFGLAITNFSIYFQKHSPIPEINPS